MQVSEKLKVEFIQELAKKKSKYFKKNIFDECLDNKYIDSSGKPTSELLFLSFEEMVKIIEDFYECYYSKYNGNELIYKNLLKKYFKYPKEKPINKISESIKKEKELFFKKFDEIYKMIKKKFSFQLQKENGIYICPYCEKNYVNLVQIEEGKKAIKPDLDHYYPKALYPFLACSIENLIPSCQVCNSKLKGEDDFYEKPHINPLKSRVFNKIKFNYDYKGIFIEKMSFFTQEERNYLDTFKIKEIYSTHTEIKDDLKTKFDKYNKVKRKHLYKSCPSLKGSDILEVIFYEYKYENPKHPLRKLKKDLFEKMNKKR